MIVANGLTKRYGDKTAVDDLSFEVRPGWLLVLGPNGAGKSTTMRLMLDLDYGGGQTRFDGRRFREIGTPCVRSVRCWRSGLSIPPGRHATTSDAGRRQRSFHAARGSGPGPVGLADVASMKPRGFSLGMAQRLGLTAALLGATH